MGTEAKQLWHLANGCTGISDSDILMLTQSLKTFSFTPRAASLLKKLLADRKKKCFLRTVNFQTYDDEMLRKAERAVSDGTNINNGEAKQIWDLTQDGKARSELEKRTLRYILESTAFPVSERAKTFMENTSTSGESESYFKTHGGCKYDLELLDQVHTMAAKGEINKPGAWKLWDSFNDGEQLTRIDAKTLLFTLENKKQFSNEGL